MAGLCESQDPSPLKRSISSGPPRVDWIEAVRAINLIQRVLLSEGEELSKPVPAIDIYLSSKQS